MLFNTPTFLIFFVIVYGLYLGLGRSRTGQNLMLLLASYVFYGWWDWRFLSLLWISTLIDFTAGRAMGNTTDPVKRKRLLCVSMSANLGMLGFFKYFNFFADSFVGLCGLLGWHPDALTLRIVLPVGISFYTFQTMSYGIDVYRGELKAHRNLIEFAAFVAFFPQLVAGPIERAANLLPQFERSRRITAGEFDAGIFLVLWGLFKKMVIADNVGPLVSAIFGATPGDVAGLDLLLATIAFAIQIYGDFSGYSDIARGVSKMLGFELMVNFRLPYFALNPSDFWARWHISLSSWLRDYLYIPLGGNRHGRWQTYRNLALTMLLGGLWHGAAWTFVVWGAYHGLLLVGYRLIADRRRLRQSTTAQPLPGGPVEAPTPALPRRLVGGAQRWALRLLMFGLVLIGWVFFRAESLPQAWWILGHIGLDTSAQSRALAFELAWYSWPLVVIQLWQHATGDLLAPARLNPVVRGLFYGFLLVWLTVFGARTPSEFIYFQF